MRKTNKISVSQLREEDCVGKNTVGQQGEENTKSHGKARADVI
jgi:hypothetical protein